MLILCWAWCKHLKETKSVEPQCPSPSFAKKRFPLHSRHTSESRGPLAHHKSITEREMVVPLGARHSRNHFWTFFIVGHGPLPLSLHTCVVCVLHALCMFPPGVSGSASQQTAVMHDNLWEIMSALPTVSHYRSLYPALVEYNVCIHHTTTF